MKTLYLPLKKEWYEMIERGEKKEEYRELTDYWIKRLCTDLNDFNFMRPYRWKIKHFDRVRFSYGYTKRTMTFEISDISVGRGREDWGAKGISNCFIISIGEKIE